MSAVGLCLYTYLLVNCLSFLPCMFWDWWADSVRQADVLQMEIKRCLHISQLAYSGNCRFLDPLFKCFELSSRNDFFHI